MSEEIIEAAATSGEHKEAAAKMLHAVREYWEWRRANGLGGAVCWVQDENGQLVVFTRGEYAESIMRAIREETGFLTPVRNDAF